jgi:transitional endoplasmic reticulum ATPase
MAASNRPDIIDSALLRPGRFDRLILVPLPDNEARRSILSIHTKPMPLKGVDMDRLVNATDGYVGADLENLCREAAMTSLREDPDAVSVEQKHFEKALKVVKASVDKDAMKFYDNMGKALDKKRAGWTKASTGEHDGHFQEDRPACER